MIFENIFSYSFLFIEDVKLKLLLGVFILFFTGKLLQGPDRLQDHEKFYKLLLISESDSLHISKVSDSHALASQIH